VCDDEHFESKAYTTSWAIVVKEGDPMAIIAQAPFFNKLQFAFSVWKLSQMYLIVQLQVIQPHARMASFQTKVRRRGVFATWCTDDGAELQIVLFLLFFIYLVLIVTFSSK